MRNVSLSVLQHVEEEPAGVISEYARGAGISCETVPVYETNEVPSLSSTHLLLLGGPMSVNDGASYPFIEQEKRLIRSWIAKGRPLLGICLGAQMVAAACGGEITSCTREIGWFQVEACDTGILPGLPRLFMAFQFHGETFSLPAGADLVCRGAQVPHQALAVGSALGLQFHLEPTPGMIRQWISDLPSGEQARVMDETVRNIQGLHDRCRRLCDRFFSACPEGFNWRPR